MRKENSIFASSVPRFEGEGSTAQKGKFDKKLSEMKKKGGVGGDISATLDASITQSAVTSSEVVEEMEDAAPKVPGPGQYYDSKLHTDFRPKAVPEIFQFFGSANERFKEEKPTDRDRLGPGTYDRF